jgi:methyl coenzyme M reductase subunit C
VRLDFTEAKINWPTLQLVVEVSHGNLTIITKPGVVVDAGEVAIQGGNVRVVAPRDAATAGTLRIDVTGTVRGGNIKARPAVSSFWAWLRRARRDDG